jgi:hypothetical protein
VAACLLLLVGGLAGPLLARQRHYQQRLACANNLRQLWCDLEAYSDRSENTFPRVEAEGPRGIAGIFVPTLQDAGLLGQASVSCPAAAPCETPRCSVRELEELYKTNRPQYDALAGQLGGHYAYCLGYREGATHAGLRRDSGDHLPILADRSGPSGEGNSPNHGGAGQNVLYVGGWVRWCTQPTVGVAGDDIYLNQAQQVRAGLTRIDTVLGASAARPYK